MSNYAEVIKRYEKARQVVVALTEKKMALVSDCDNMKQGDDHHNWELREPCLVVAWSWMKSENKGEPSYNCVSYDEVILSGEDFDIGTVSGSVCDKCLEAYKMKRGDIAEAKKEFGAAKRSLSAIGKRIMRDENDL